MSKALKVASVIVFVLALFGVQPVNMIALGLALFAGSEVV